MNNSIAKEFHFVSLLKFAFPSIVMMIFMSLYTMVDGMFVSRFVSTSALSAVNIVYPIYNVIIAIGIMLATGGSAVIAKKMGENKMQAAKENFSLLVLVGIIIGFVILILGILFIKPLIRMLGANASIFSLCHDYAFTLLLFTPLAILQMLFQYFFITAGKPGLGLLVTTLGGLANMILDYIFIVTLSFGITGAALGTGIGVAIPAVVGILYFSLSRKGTLYLVKPKWEHHVLLDSCVNGSSEMVTNLAVAVTTFLYNIIMMRTIGEDGVAAVTIILYAQFLLNALFFGFSMGVAPVISFNYGCTNIIQTKRLFRYSIVFVLTTSILSFIAAIFAAPLIIGIFAHKGSTVYEIAMSGFAIFSINYLFAGINIFASSMFTAFSNGKVSAIISFMRTFLFISSGLLLLPRILGTIGVWLAVPIAEGLTLFVCLFFFKRYRNVYHYL